MKPLLLGRFNGDTLQRLRALGYDAEWLDVKTPTLLVVPLEPPVVTGGGERHDDRYVTVRLIHDLKDPAFKRGDAFVGYDPAWWAKNGRDDDTRRHLAAFEASIRYAQTKRDAKVCAVETEPSKRAFETVPGGSLVYIMGLPFKLTYDTRIEGTDANFKLAGIR